jgi:hypothetical protein
LSICTTEEKISFTPTQQTCGFLKSVSRRSFFRGGTNVGFTEASLLGGECHFLCCATVTLPTQTTGGATHRRRVTGDLAALV